MAEQDRRAELEKKLERYRKLEKRIGTDPDNRRLRALIAALEREIQELDQK